MKWLWKRLSEPSTYGGLAALIMGVGTLGKINEAPAIADAVGQAGAAVAGGVDPVTAGIAAAAGAAAVFMGEKGDRQ